MPATTVVDSMYQGDAAIVTIPVVNSAGKPVDLTGASMTYVLEPSIGQAATITKSTANGGITITNASQGLAQLKLSSTDTSGLSVTTYYHQATMTDASGDSLLIFSGNLTIKQKG